MKFILSTFILLLSTFYGYSQCTPSFTIAQQTASGNNLLTATIQSVSSPSTTHTRTYSLDWGDGTGQSGFNYWSRPSHMYSTPGTYTVKLILTVSDTVNNIVHCIDSTTQSLTISYQPCATAISAIVNTQNNGQVTFTATTPANTPNMTYIWNYRDGHIDTTQNTTISHTYSYSGNFNVHMTAIDSNNTCSYVNNVLVSVLNGCGQADFVFTSNGLATNFYNSSTYVNGYVETSTWDFGDGNTSTQLHQLHNYATSGTYNVQLITTWFDSSNNTVYCRDTVTKPVTVTGNNPGAYSLAGSIVVDSGLNLPQVYRVWLIVYDSTLQTLTAIDTLTVTNSAGAIYTPYAFTNVTPGIYRVKAKLMNAQAQNTSYVPTYHDSALLWSNAGIIYHTANGTANKNINMRHGTPTTGPGFIGGSVNQGANKGTANGIADMPVYLVDMNGKLLQYSETDATGSYSFSNLPTGTYKVYPEELNYTTTPALVTLTNSSTSLNGIYFERSHAQKSITPIPTSIRNIEQEKILYIYPNPASRSVTINWTGKQTANIMITDITGKQVLTNDVAANSIKQIDISTLTKGLYFVTVGSSDQRTTQKLLITQ